MFMSVIADSYFEYVSHCQSNFGYVSHCQSFVPHYQPYGRYCQLYFFMSLITNFIGTGLPHMSQIATFMSHTAN